MRLTRDENSDIVLKMSQDSSLTIFRSAAKFFSGTLISRVSGLLRDMSIAYAFGTESALGTFFIAFRFSHLARRLFGEGSLQTAFVPCFEEIRNKDEKQALYFFRDLNLLLAFGLFLFIGIGCTLLSFSQSELLNLTALMLPSLFFICLYGLNTAYLECEKSFFTPSIAPVAFNLTWIAAAFLFANSVQPMQALSLAVVVGCFAQWACTLPKTYSFAKSKGLKFFDHCNLLSPEIKRFAKPLLFANIGVAASQINNALDPLFARIADPEGPAWLWFAIRLQQLPLSLFGIALAGALLPPLSRAAKANDQTSFQALLDYAVLKTAQLMIPITFATISLASSAICLIYGRGQFQTESVMGTASCLWAYSLGLLPMSLILILAPSFYAKNDYKTPLYASLSSIMVNIFLNALLIFGFGLNASSVAVATSIAAWINCSMLYSFKWFSKPLIPYLLASISGSGGVFLLNFFRDNTLQFNFFSQVERFGLEALVFILGFGAIMVFTKRPIFRTQEMT